MKKRFKASVTLAGQYLGNPDKAGKRHDMFRYVLTCNSETLEAYKAIKGDYYDEDETGKPLYHTRHAVLGGVIIIDLESEKIYEDKDYLAKMNSMLMQLPEGPIRDAMAQRMTDQLMRNFDAPVQEVEEKSSDEPVASSEDTDDTELNQL